MKYILGALGFILLLLIVAVIILNGGGDAPAPATNAAREKQLVDYAKTDSTVSLTTIGRLVGDDQRRAIRVLISPNERRIEILGGYEQSVINSQSYPNDRVAYENFLSALNAQGFTQSKESDIEDQRGACPAGNRFVYDLSDKGSSISNLWATTCDDNGTFDGRGSSIRQLFQRQIPDYSKQVNDVRL